MFDPDGGHDRYGHSGDGCWSAVPSLGAYGASKAALTESLLRMANFYANVAHAGISEFDACLDLVTELPARLMNLRDYGIAIGNPADGDFAVATYDVVGPRARTGEAAQNSS